MIEPAYVQLMARYNAWQNSQLTGALEPASHAVLTLNRRAFFGSILGTLNHILWADMLWMSRFDRRVDAPSTPHAASPELMQTIGEWSAARFSLDGQIRRWASGLKSVDLKGNLRFHSVLKGSELEKPMAEMVMFLFNHQTHHRGQVHAMMTAAGLEAPVTDLPFLPEDV